jgi:hypothetical protein
MAFSYKHLHMTSLSPAQATLAGAGILMVLVSIYLLVARQDMAWIWPAWLGVLAVAIAVYDGLARCPCCRDT